MFADWPPDLSAWTPADWSAAGTVATAAVAVIAAAFALVQVLQSRRVRKEKDQPYVIVYFEISEVWGNAVNLVIENIGQTMARDVRMEFEPQLQTSARTKDINETKLIKDGLSAMPPRMKLWTLFDLTHVRFTSGLPMDYSVEVSFRGLRRKREKLTYTLDLGIFYGLEGFRPYGQHQVAKSLQEISGTLKKWTGRRGRLNVWVKDEDYDEWEDLWLTRHGGDTPSLGVPHPAGRRAPSKYRQLREPLLVRVYWIVRLPFQRRLQEQREKREDDRLEKIGRPDLALARKRSRGEA